MILSANASQVGVVSVLSHVLPDGNEKPIAYASRTLSAKDKSYLQTEKEGLGVIFGIKHFHKYLYGHEFVITTDHKPLLGLFRGR